MIATDSEIELARRADGQRRPSTAASAGRRTSRANGSAYALESNRERAHRGDRPATDANISVAAAADRLLVDRCLAGDELAWQTLYEEFHSPLLLAIRILLGRSAARHDLVDDIAQKVWCTVIDRQAQLLDRFDSARGCRLSTFLAGLAKNEISRHFRAEWRRTVRETHATRARRADADGLWRGAGGLSSAMSEFLATLTPRERSYCEQHLLTTDESVREEYSDANRWQLHRRVRLKLCAFLKIE